MKPILFNTNMVRAILGGRKTVTRRVVKPQPDYFFNCIMGEPRKVCSKGYGAVMPDKTDAWIKPPYHPGDILWVRETWQEIYETEWSEDKPHTGKNIRELISNFDSIQKVEAGISSECKSEKMKPRMKYFVFKASDIQYTDGENGLIWRPSIYMPREAARIFLRVTGVRVERLQDINLDPPGPENQVIKEGLHYLCDFIAVWEMTTKKRDRPTCGWDANPWVWVIEFERIRKEEAENENRKGTGDS